MDFPLKWEYQPTAMLYAILNGYSVSQEEIMTSLITRGSLFDDFFKDVAPGFFIKPLHGDALPAASQIRVGSSQKNGQ